MRTIIVSLLLITAFGCRKKCSSGSMVIRDCTGTYLRFEGKDHPVCNPAVLNPYADSAVVRVKFKKAGSGKCEAKDDIHCMMVHPYELGEWIVVSSIN